MKKFIEPVTHMIVHCSASKWGTHRDIAKWHQEYDDIGYHAVILGPRVTSDLHINAFDGQIVPCRPIEYIGAHCRDGGMNHKSIGVMLFGIDEFSDNQFRSLVKYHDSMSAYYGTPLIVEPHYKYNKNKTCPNFLPNVEMDRVKRLDEVKPSVTKRLKDLTIGEFIREISE